MLDLNKLLQPLVSELNVKVEVLEGIIKGIYSISSGGVTMKNISRWAGKGCSYRTVQRFFSSPIDWLALNLLLLRVLVVGVPTSMRYVLAVDEVVEKKAGKHTWGVGWFYSSIADKAIRSVSNHAISLVDTEKESSFVLTHRQTVKPQGKEKKGKNQGEKKTKTAAPSTPSKSKGRPPGSKNKHNVKNKGLLYESFEALLGLVTPLLLVLCPNLKYVLADGAYGNKTCCLIVRQFGLELISKLNRNTALYLPYSGVYKGKGRPSKYGDKLDYDRLPAEYLVSDELDGGVRTRIFQVKGVWTKTMPYLINTIIITKTRQSSDSKKPTKTSRVVLFSTDLELEADNIIKLYSLRFQIEFNFRDAKQYFGLADFKNIKEQQVGNAVGMAFFMDNISLILREQAKAQWDENNISIQDIKAYFRSEKYIEIILNTLGIDPEPILNHHQFDHVRKVGAINRDKMVV